MANVKINEILGSDSISGSRLTINSNFLVLKNWINGYQNNFGVDVNNSTLDLTGNPNSKITVNTARINNLSFPITGTPLAYINTNGEGSFVSLVSTSLNVSGSCSFGGNISIINSGSFTSAGAIIANDNLTANGEIKIGNGGHIISENTKIKTTLGANAEFPLNTTGNNGSGVTTTISTPYEITGLEDVIYADCSGDGLFISVVSGTGGTGSASILKQGTRITIVNTSTLVGKILTGLQNSNGYYTGFNTDTTHGGYSATGITITVNKAYRSAITLQWEQRINKNGATQSGSWIVLSSTNVTV